MFPANNLELSDKICQLCQGIEHSWTVEHFLTKTNSSGAENKGLQGTRHCGFCRFSKTDQDQTDLLFLSLSQTDQRFAKRFIFESKKKDVLTSGPPRTEQILWPRHCVQRTWGAELHPRLKVTTRAFCTCCLKDIDSQVPVTAKTILKGQESFVDAYSCFFDNLKQVITLFEF